MIQDDIAVTNALYNKIMREEKYNCKKPGLLRIIEGDKNALDCAYPAKAAIVLGKCLQGLMKVRGEKKLTEKTLNDAVAAIMKFDKTVAVEAIYFAKENTFRIIMATWKNGDQIAPFVGLTKTGYESSCCTLKQDFVKTSKAR